MSVEIPNLSEIQRSEQNRIINFAKKAMFVSASIAVGPVLAVSMFSALEFTVIQRNGLIKNIKALIKK